MKQPALFSDGDGTLYRWQLVLDWLDALAPQYPRVAAVIEAAAPALRKYRNRRGPFMAYADIIVQEFWDKRAYVGIRQSDAHEAARAVAQHNQQRTYVFTRELIHAAQDIGWPVIIVSGSPHEAVEEFMKFFSVTEIIGTRHAVDANGIYTDAPIHMNPADNKGRFVRDYADCHNIDLSSSVAIGDSHGDIPMLEAVRYPICFNPNTRLREKAEKESWPITVEARDQLYFLQGREARHWGAGLPMDLYHALRKRIPRRTE